MATTAVTLTNAISVSQTKQLHAPQGRGKKASATTLKQGRVGTRASTRRETEAKKLPTLRFRDIEDSDGDYYDDEDESQGTIEELVALGKGLAKTIEKQHTTIKEAHTALKEVKEEQETLKTQRRAPR
jgi:hypothetical protein